MVAAVSADKQHAAADSISSAPAGPHPQKRRKGLIRLYYATGYSLAGLFAAFRESPALGSSVVMTPNISPLNRVLPMESD